MCCNVYLPKRIVKDSQAQNFLSPAYIRNIYFLSACGYDGCVDLHGMERGKYRSLRIIGLGASQPRD